MIWSVFFISSRDIFPKLSSTFKHNDHLGERKCLRTDFGVVCYTLLYPKSKIILKVHARLKSYFNEKWVVAKWSRFEIFTTIPKRDLWHVTCDMWHMVGWTFSQNDSSLVLTVWERHCFEDKSTKDDLVIEWINN